MDVTGDMIANEVLLSRTKFDGTILIVEGETDGKLYQNFAPNTGVSILPSWGKENVLEAVRILEQESTSGFLAIVDADFCHIEDCCPDSSNILVTDDHDIDMMIFRSDSLLRVVRELGSLGKLQAFLQEHGASDLREVLLERAIPLGHLRRYSLVQGLALRFEGLRFERFVDTKTLDLDIHVLVRSVHALTECPDLTTSELEEILLEALNEAPVDPYQLCCGHDVVSLVGIGLRRAIGSRSKKATESQLLEGILRLSYDSQEFRTSTLYAKAKEWEHANQPFLVFD